MGWSPFVSVSGSSALCYFTRYLEMHKKVLEVQAFMQGWRQAMQWELVLARRSFSTRKDPVILPHRDGGRQPHQAGVICSGLEQFYIKGNFPSNNMTV